MKLSYTPTNTRPHARTAWSALALAAALPTLACDVPPTDDAEPAPVEAQSTALVSAGDTVCSVVDALPEFDLGAVYLDKPTCSEKKNDNLFYFGNSPAWLVGLDRPAREAQAFYCTLKGVNGGVARATKSTAFGKFGLESRVRIYNDDPKEGRLTGERIGRLFAFGLGLDLEQQDFEWTTRGEGADGPSGPAAMYTPHGTYGSLVTSGGDWNIGGGGRFPIGGGLYAQVGLGFWSRPHFGAHGNDVIAASPPGSSFAPAPQNSFQAHVDACTACQTKPLPPGFLRICTMCPTKPEIDAHDAGCGGSPCTSRLYRNLTDGYLPTSGSTGPFLFRGYTNWFHVGRPGTGPSARRATARTQEWASAVEPIYSLDGDPNKNATTKFSLGVGVGWDAGIAAIRGDIVTDVNFRDGLALRQEMKYHDPDSRDPDLVETRTSLDAESSIDVKAHFRLWLDIPFVSNPVVEETFKLLHTAKESSENATSVALWDPRGGTEHRARVHAYSTRGTAHTDGFASCFASDPVTGTPTPMASPQAFAEHVKTKAEGAVHPCNVVLCTTNGSTTQKRTCTWNAATKSLSCTVVGAGCSCTENRFDMCDDAGNVYTPEARSTNGCTEVPR